MLTGQRLLIAVLVAVTSPLAARADGADSETAPAIQTRHFDQTGTINLSEPGPSAAINTFCVDPQGRLLVAVGGTQLTTRVTSAGREVEQQKIAGAIRVYSPEGELLETWPLEFTPQALNVGPEGHVFVAGAGTIARLDERGRITRSGATPQIGNREEFKAAVQVELDERNKQYVKMFDERIERAQELVDRLEQKPEDERSNIDQLRMKSAQRQLDLLKQQSERLAGSLRIDLDSYMNHKLKVPGLAVSERDVFIAVSATKGYGYEVWRLDHDFANATRICSGLRGCCGQMDIQVEGDDLYVAENSRHRVCRYDREGKELCTWGKSDRTGKDGFEGCCNPMNLRFTPAGEVLTAESGSGVIKRFSPEGEYLGLVGRASLQGGCKHVAISASPEGDRLYMLDITRTRIAVLSPTSKAATTPGSQAHVQDAPAAEETKTGTGGILRAVFEALVTGETGEGSNAGDDN